MTRFLVPVLTLVAALASAQDRPLPNFDSFVAEAKKRLQPDSDRQAGYAYTERRTEQEFDGSGRVKDQKVRVFEVYPGLPGEDRYLRLIEENGKPVPPKELEKTDRERQKKAEQFAREQAALTESDRQRQLRDYQKAQKQRAEEIDDVFAVFDIRMVGREPVEGHDTILFTLTPRPNAKPRTESGRILQRFSARAWISEADYELVRIQAEAVENVTFGFGLLARIDKGATFTFERRKVNGEIWLPALATYRGSGRLLLVRGMRLGGTSEFSNYRKFTVETTTEIGAGEKK
jgi:hypothetical protein